MIISIDIGGTSIKLGAISEHGEILEKTNVLIANCKDENSFKDMLLTAVRRILEKYDAQKPRGIGVAAPSCQPEEGEIVNPSNLPIQGRFPISEILEVNFGLPTTLIKDSTAFLLGEKYYGAARDLTDFAVITLGTGLGSAIMINGKLVHGAHGWGSEWGHSVTVDQGRECGCGKKGCLETYTSAKGICRTAFELMATTNTNSVLRSIPFNYLSAKDIYNAAKEGDLLAREVFDITARHLGTKLSDFVLTYSPEVIFLSGGVSQSKEFLLKPTQHYLDLNLIEQFKGITRIAPSGLAKSDAALLGVASTLLKTQKTKIA